MKITIGIVDDHQLFLKSLGVLINGFDSCEVTVDALNGECLMKKLSLLNDPPDILLVDVDMPVMNGLRTARMVADKYPLVKITALSQKDDDATIINMIRSGCCAYLLKDIHPDELEKALMEIKTTGYYNGDVYNVNYRRLMNYSEAEKKVSLTTKETTFLKLSCSELTYKQIASQMNLSERTIDGYRESLFRKLNVQTRVGMVMETIRRKLITL